MLLVLVHINTSLSKVHAIPYLYVIKETLVLIFYIQVRKI